jgi:hypothetical protein
LFWDILYKARLIKIVSLQLGNEFLLGRIWNVYWSIKSDSINRDPWLRLSERRFAATSSSIALTS